MTRESLMSRWYIGYASLVAHHAQHVMLAGTCLALLSIVGIMDVTYNNDYLDLWMYKGTRLDAEKDFYEEHFGGVFRTQTVLVSDDKLDNIATKKGLDGVLQAVQFMDDESEAAITFELENNTYGIADLCDRPAVPVVFQPYPADKPLSWMGGQFMSYGYRFMSNCTKQGGGVSIHPSGLGSYTAPEEDLLDGWGIERFPCTRSTVLDCFAEGNFDYPQALRQVDDWSDFLMWNSMREGCLDSFASSVEQDLITVFRATGAVDDPHVEEVASSTAEQLRASLNRTISAFWKQGYHWKKSYGSMTDQEIFYHLQTAIKNANGDLEPTQCVVEEVPCCLNWSGLKIENGLTFAGVEHDPTTGNLTAIKYLMNAGPHLPHNHPTFMDNMENEFNVTLEEDRKAIHNGWEQAFLDVQEPNFRKVPGTGFAEGESFDGVHVDYFSARSGIDVMEQGNRVEAHLVMVAYSVMLGFAAIAMGHWKFSAPLSTLVYSRVLLSLGGFFVIFVSTLSSFGFMSNIKMDLTPLQVNIVPFLSLGIGIDDMFILTYTLLRNTTYSHDPERRLKETLVKAGPSVLVTTVANAGCFLVAAGLPINIIRSFAVHMGIQMLLHAFFLHLIFVPMMFWDSQRVAACRADVVLTKIPEDKVEPEAEFAEQNIVSKFVKWGYSPLLASKCSKGVVILLSLGATISLGWYGANYTRTGLVLSSLCAEDTYQESFLRVFEEDIDAQVALLVTKGVDMGTYQKTLLDVQEAVQEVPFISESIRVRDISWLADSGTSFLGAGATPMPPQDFKEAFQSWISTLGISSVNSFSCRDSEGQRVDCSKYDAATTEIVASTQKIFLRDQVCVENITATVQGVREAIDRVDPNRETFAYGESFVMFSQYQYTEQSYTYILGVGAGIVTVVIGILGGSFVLGGIICSCIFTAVVQVYGCLALIGVNINGFSLVNLCVTIGFVVEFTAHFGRAFLMSSGVGLERMIMALDELFWPILAGGMTTFLAVLPITFSKITFFHQYYFQTYTIIVVVCLFAGVALFPVLLSITNPKVRRHNEAFLHQKDMTVRRLNPFRRAFRRGPPLHPRTGSSLIFM